MAWKGSNFRLQGLNFTSRDENRGRHICAVCEIPLLCDIFCDHRVGTDMQHSSYRSLARRPFLNLLQVLTVFKPCLEPL